MKRLLLMVTIISMTIVLTGCPGENTEEIVVIIEDATFNGNDGNGTETIDTGTVISPEDTTTEIESTEDTVKTPIEPQEKRMTLSGAVALLKRDLAREDLTRLNRHAEALDKAITGELEKAGESGRKRTLNLFSIKLGSFKRSLKRLKDEEIPDDVKTRMEETLTELTELAKRIEGK